MLSLARSGLAAVNNTHAAIYWARAYEALLPPSPANGYIGSIVEVLKYPNTAIKEPTPSEEERQRFPHLYETLSAREFLQKKISGHFPKAKELESGNLTDLVDWIAKNYPMIDPDSPPARPTSLHWLQYS